MQKEQIKIFDTTLRDGEQAPGYSMHLDEKLRMALQLEALGVDVIEAGFAIASPGDFQSVNEIAKTIKNCTVASLCRALVKDIDAAAKAVKPAAHARIHTFIATSDLHLKYKLKIGRADCLRQIKEMVAYARNYCDEVEFSAEDASRTDLDFLCKATETAIKAGATIVNLPDTVGYSVPEEIYRMVKTVHEKVPNIDKAILSMHCHDDLGLGVANSLAGVRAGARQVECTICGIGERAGNAAMEEIAMNLRVRHDYYKGLCCNLKTEELMRTANLLATITGIKTAPNKAIVGANAFAHESGIHQHGVLAKAETYEIMTPESVGVKRTELVLGKHSGRHAFAERLKELGYGFDEDKIDQLFAEFKQLADEKKVIAERDLVALAESKITVRREPKSEWKLDNFVVNSGNLMSTTAQVTLSKGGKIRQEVALATGPVYASFAAIEKIIKHKFTLEDYQIHAVTEHRDALGEVIVKIKDKQGMYRGRGVSTDIIKGSILALLSAVNRMMQDQGE
ncbi:MAG: 2-isopropylmalate synthase [Kiritimatiellae bacterium]|nr:2-isopropylmalate synthase [Kiritimatiellia bacterium]